MDNDERLQKLPNETDDEYLVRIREDSDLFVKFVKNMCFEMFAGSLPLFVTKWNKDYINRRDNIDDPSTVIIDQRPPEVSRNPRTILRLHRKKKKEEEEARAAMGDQDQESEESDEFVEIPNYEDKLVITIVERCFSKSESLIELSKMIFTDIVIDEEGHFTLVFNDSIAMRGWVYYYITRMFGGDLCDEVGKKFDSGKKSFKSFIIPRSLHNILLNVAENHLYFENGEWCVAEHDINGRPISKCNQNWLKLKIGILEKLSQIAFLELHSKLPEYIA